MNLSAIALRRAEEQVSVPGWRIVHNPTWTAAPKDRSRSARVLKCDCGDCHTCRNRIAMRQRRSLGVKPPPKPRGPSMALGRVCGHTYQDGRKCVTPIADWNRSGLCCGHRRWAWDAANRKRDRSRASRLAERAET